jgi:hypothetical protein
MAGGGDGRVAVAGPRFEDDGRTVATVPGGGVAAGATPGSGVFARDTDRGRPAGFGGGSPGFAGRSSFESVTCCPGVDSTPAAAGDG